MKVAASPRIYMWRCPKVCDGGFLSYRQPSPRGEGAPKGRIGHRRYERGWKKCGSSRRFTKAPYPPLRGPPSPRGEGAPKGRIGHRRYERGWKNASQVDDLRKYPSAADAVPLPQWGRQIGGGFAAIDDEVAAVLAFVISHTTFLAAQDDEMGRCAPPLSQTIKGRPRAHPLSHLPSVLCYTKQQTTHYP